MAAASKVQHAIVVEMRSPDGKDGVHTILFSNKTIFRRTIREDVHESWRGNSIGEPVSWLRDYVQSQGGAPSKRLLSLVPTVVQVTPAEAEEARSGRLARGLRSRVDAVYAAQTDASPARPDVETCKTRLDVLLGFYEADDSDELDDAVHPKGRAVAGRKVKEEVARSYDAILAEASKGLPEISAEGTVTRPNGQVYTCRPLGDLSDVAALRIARMDDLGVFMFGPPGTGKTVLAEAAFGDRLRVVMGTSDTDIFDFIGNWIPNPDGTFTWVDGPLIDAMENGKALLVDEVGLVDPKVMSIVYSAMDGRREISITQNPARGVVKAAPGFFVVGATNPDAPGVRLSEALLSRFAIHVEITTDYDLAERLGVASQLVSAARNLETKRLNKEGQWSPQLRELLATTKVAERFGPEMALRNLVSSAPEGERQQVAEVLANVYGREIAPLAHDRA